MAEAILKAELVGRRAGAAISEVHVASAGIDARTRDSISANAVAAIHGLGLKLGRRRAKLLTAANLRTADLVLTMTESQKQRVLARWPDAAGKTFVISEFSGSGRDNIQDPVGGSESVYKACARQLRGEIRKMMPRLARRLKERVTPL